jgi:Cellulose binding domain
VNGKHASVASGLARLFPGDDPWLRRGWTGVGIVLAVAALVWSVVWVQHAAHRDATPRVAQPVAEVTLDPPVLAGPPALTPSSFGPAPSAAVPSSRASSSPPRVKPSPSKKPATTPPKPKKTGNLIASYAVGSNWDTGFIAAITVTNNTGADVWPTVRVHNAPADGVRVNQVWTGSVTRDGDTVVFSAGKLAPGGTMTIGFDATKNAGPKALPSSCTIDGGTCRVS